ncbi:hypothetical protein GCM10010492_24580 [Saccharothrix mutabilis subsp. mutabilis]|uniref:Uncharacterized protein n=1 Tax=Saccharothrix mutabilis subsp. mutabilis TaxID=66855 RepID=A0ABN0TMK8_9PSEU
MEEGQGPHLRLTPSGPGRAPHARARYPTRSTAPPRSAKPHRPTRLAPGCSPATHRFRRAKPACRAYPARRPPPRPLPPPPAFRRRLRSAAACAPPLPPPPGPAAALPPLPPGPAAGAARICRRCRPDLARRVIASARTRPELSVPRGRMEAGGRRPRRRTGSVSVGLSVVTPAQRPDLLLPALDLGVYVEPNVWGEHDLGFRA